MNIIWNHNPLATVVELDDRDRRLMRLAMENDEVRYAILDAIEYIEHGKPEQAMVKLRDIMFDEQPRLTRLLVGMEAGLREAHNGDCTCVASRCMKCVAEEALAINTIDGLEKHEAAKVAEAFGKEGKLTLSEAIRTLATYNPKFTWGRNREIWDANLPRWREEAKHAHAWLVAYRDLHFPEVR